jgi:NB-ARC domain-containing protein
MSADGADHGGARFEHVQGVQAGDHNQQINIFTSGVQTEWPRQAGIVPPLAVNRQPRAADDELQPVLEQVVIVGFGGVGKTQVAAAYARRRWAEQGIDLLVWVNAASAETLRDGLQEAARAATGDVSATPEHLISWLATTERRWLVVLDDVGAVGDVGSLWPPRTRTGQTVITSRLRDSSLLGGRRVVEVDLFSTDEAVNYLRERLPAAVFERPAAERLAEALGHLPLALAQAAAFIADLDLDCVGYLTRFADRKRTLADVLPHPSSLPDQQRATVTVTWSLSIETVDSRSPAGVALPLLRVLSGLYTLSPFLRILEGSQVRKHLTQLRPGQAPVSAEEVRDTIASLQRFNLITVKDQGWRSVADRVVEVHPLLARVVREGIPPDLKEAYDAAVATGMREVMIRLGLAQFAEPPLLDQALTRGMLKMTEKVGNFLWKMRGH